MIAIASEPAGTTERPAYYKAGDFEAVDVIEALDMGPGFYCGNVIKYLFRCGGKMGSPLIEDIKKARTYLDLYITYLEGKQMTKPPAQ